MDVNENNYISVEDDIKQIAQDLLKESKIQKTIRIRYLNDKSDNEPCILYRRFESIPEMQEMGLLKILLPVEYSSYPRNLWPYDLRLIENPIYKVKITRSKLERYLINLGIAITTQQPLVYHKIERKIEFQGKSISIPEGDQSMVCEALFKNKQSMRHEWQWEEVFEVIGDTVAKSVKEQWRKVYNAGREINKKVAVETGLKDLLLVRKQTIVVNPRYLSKS